MDVAWRSLKGDSAVPGGRRRCVFTGCRKRQPGELGTLYVEGNPTDGVPVEFRDADGEVHFPHVVICRRGSLRVVLQNRWNSGAGGGFYSLLHYAKKLEIEDNLQALQDLAAYAEGTYPLDGRWQRQELSRGMEVIVQRTSKSAPLVRRLAGRFDVVMTYSCLDAKNAVSDACWCHIFTDCRGTEPQSLTVDAPLSAPGSEQQLQFNGADGEVHVPHIIVGPRGALAATVRNRWWNGGDGSEYRSGYYSLLPYAQRLEVRDNLQALRDLLDYAEGTYPLDGRWQRQELPGGMRVTVWCTEADLPVVDRLRRHFRAVAVQGLSAALRADNTIGPGFVRFAFTSCRAVRPQSLTVDAGVGHGGVEFRGADTEVHIPRIIILGGGSLRAVLQNRWNDGRGGGGYYSLLHHAGALTIWNNPVAVQDLVAYMDGTFKLGAHWRRQQLDVGM